MNTKEFAESEYLNPSIVKESPTKRAVILGKIESIDVTFQGKTFNKLSMEVEIDGKKKTYRPSKDTIRNLHNTLGYESNQWLGRTLLFKIITVMGKECLIGEVE